MADKLLIDRATDANNSPVGGAQCFVSDTGTSTPRDTFTTQSTDVRHQTPIIADGAGLWPDVFISGSTDVRVDLRDPSTGASLPGYPQDPYPRLSLGVSGADETSLTPTAAIPATDVQAGVQIAATKVAVSSDDTTPDVLISKVQGGTGISVAEQTPGGNEQLQIAATGALAELSGLALQAGDIVYHDGSSLIRLPIGASGQALITNAAADAPGWAISLGQGQTWQDVLASRALATSYQNTTSGPILVSISVRSTTSNPTSYEFEVSTDNSTWINIATTGGRYPGFSVDKIIPANYYYRFTRTEGSSDITTWAELR